MPIAPGAKLGPYELVCLLGAGGMGNVYRARDLRLQREVALKVISEDLVRDPEHHRRFEQEARAISALSHPNICALYDVGSQDGIEYLVMELVQGETLASRLPGPLSISDVLEIAIQLADALDKAHRNGILHRDLKPANVMLTEHGAKLLDFGLAKTFQNSPAWDDATVTVANHVVGTLNYMSPEQLRAQSLDGRTDIWSLGVIVYQMLAGRHPFGAASSSDTIAAILALEPPILRDFRPDCPDRLEEIVHRTMAKDREQRYQSARDLMNDLKQLKRRLDSGNWDVPISTSSRPAVAPTGSAMQPATASMSLRKRAALAAVLLLLVAAGATVGIRLYQPTATSLAVLPFAYDEAAPAADSSERDYLADGITESVIESASQIPNLNVIARSSVFQYKNKPVDPEQVAKVLGVGAVLVGRLAQRGDRIVATVELVDGRDQHRIWGERYERSGREVTLLPGDIAADVSHALRFTWRRQSLPPGTQDPAAYKAYLKGRFHWNKRNADDLRQAIQYFQQAIDADPHYALAYVGMAQAYHVLWVYANLPPTAMHAEALAAVNQALQMDPQLAEAHATVAAIRADDEWDFTTAEREFKRAVELNPKDATTRFWYAQFLTYLGRFPEARAQIEKAREIDPLAPVVQAVEGSILLRLGRSDDAVARLRGALALDPNLLPVHFILRSAWVEKQNFAQVIAEDEAIARIAGASAEEAARDARRLRQAFDTGGEPAYWRARLQLSQERVKSGRITGLEASPFRIAELYAHLGDRDQVFVWLEKAYQQHDINLVYLKSEPVFAEMRSDPRAAELLRRIGLL